MRKGIQVSLGAGQPARYEAEAKVTVGFRCSKDGRDFFVELVRRGVVPKYQVSQVNLAARPEGASAKMAPANSLTIPGAEITWGGFECPSCGTRRGKIRNSILWSCGACGGLMCAGGETGHLLPCTWCGEVGDLRNAGHIDTYSGRREQSQRQSGPSFSGLSGPSDLAKLAGPDKERRS